MIDYCDDQSYLSSQFKYMIFHIFTCTNKYIKQTFGFDAVPWGIIRQEKKNISLAHPLGKKTSITTEQKSDIFVTFQEQIFFLLKWIKSGKESVYEKKNGVHRASKRVNGRRS